jgi:hypothetical protein
MSPAVLFGDAQRPKAIEGKPGQAESPAQLPGGTDKPAQESVESAPDTSDENQPGQS